jgi:hypothetical protein
MGQDSIVLRFLKNPIPLLRMEWELAKNQSRSCLHEMMRRVLYDKNERDRSFAYSENEREILLMTDITRSHFHS